MNLARRSENNGSQQRRFSIERLQSPKGFNFFRENSRLWQRGFTIIEVIVYVVILALVSLVIVVFVNQLLGVNETTRRTREALDNARRVLDTITQEVRHAESVYTPTSSFGVNPGQLSLETSRDTPTDENTTFVDFYVDNNGVYIKRDGQTTQLLTSEKVKITDLTFTNLNGSTSWPAIRISITVEYISPIFGPKNTVTLKSTAVLRSL